jgi:hypothetical protein
MFAVERRQDTVAVTHIGNERLWNPVNLCRTGRGVPHGRLPYPASQPTPLGLGKLLVNYYSPSRFGRPSRHHWSAAMIGVEAADRQGSQRQVPPEQLAE